jgi:PKD repeat protein
MNILKFTLLLALAPLVIVLSQNWPTIGGSNQRNGLTKMTAPDNVSSPYWTVTSSISLWGNSVFTYGNKFATSRVTFTPTYTAKVECRSLSNGSFLWEKQISDSSIMYTVGFNEFAVYVHDYKTDTLYALSPIDGLVLWSTFEFMFGGKSGILFACNRDPIVFGRRLDKLTGETIWQYNYIVPVGPDAGYAMFGDTYYHWSGSITTPKKVFALDAETGQFKYESLDLPGDGDQEIPLTIGSDGTIYVARDGGLLYALEDNGTALNIKWTYNPITSLTGYFGSDINGNVYIIDGGKVRRLNANTGAVIDSSAINLVSGFLSTITVDAEGKVIVCNAEAGAGKYYCFSSDLQTLYWELALPYNYYCGPSIGKEGVMVLIGSGTQINAYKTNSVLKPAADFYADITTIEAGQSVNFFDQSSFIPTSWDWSFPGAATLSSVEQNPQNIVYNSPGVYEVTLTSTNALGSDSLTKFCYIKVDQATFTADETVLPNKFELLQNYPNPFNPNTRIQYTIVSKEFVTIKVYDLLGKEVATLVNNELSTGIYEVEFDGSNLPSGIYIYKLAAGNYTLARKMMILK